MRYLALDVGDERIGIALSDANALIARPLEIIARVKGPTSFRRIARLVAEHEVEAIVVGLPLLPDGSEGKQVSSTRAYVRELENHVAIPIIYWDERDTTLRAHQIVAENRPGRPLRREPVDDVAAAVILQDFLNERAEEWPQ